MKSLKRNKGMRILAGAIAIAFVLIFVATPYQLSANVCTDAFKDCIVSVAVSALMSLLEGFIPGVVIALSYTPFCYRGYAFCMAYFIKE